MPVCRIAPNSGSAVKAMFGILQVQHDWKRLRGKKKSHPRFLNTKIQSVCQDMFTPQITGCLSTHQINITSNLLFTYFCFKRSLSDCVPKVVGGCSIWCVKRG